MMKYLVVDPKTGEIVQHGLAQQQSMIPPIEPGLELIEDVWGVSSEDYYWDGSKPQPMLALGDVIKQVGEDPWVFTGIPKGTSVLVWGEGSMEDYPVDDGEIVYDTDVPGVHRFFFRHPTYKSYGPIRVMVE